MKKLLVVASLVLVLAGCAQRVVGFGSSAFNVPKIEIPEAPAKPDIKTKVFEWQGEQVVAYSWPDALKLFEFLVQKDAFEDKLKLRIDVQNQLLESFVTGKPRN